MIVELTNNIKVIRPEAKAMYPYSNSLYIEDETNMLIDAGAGGTAYSEIAAENVELLLLSHYHFDHTHCTDLFPQANIMAGQEEASTYSNLADYINCSGFLEWQSLMGNPKLEQETSGFPYPDDVPARPGFRCIELAGGFDDGSVFTLGKTEVRTIHTPGHTRGHYAFLCEKEGILFSADLDLSPRGPWYGDGMSDVDEIISSVEKIIQIEPATLVTSHRRIFNSKNDDIKKMFRDYLDIILSREQKILDYLNQPRSIDQIAEQDLVYEPGQFNQYLIFWNKVMIVRHLKRLIRMGQVKELEAGHYMKA